VDARRRDERRTSADDTRIRKSRRDGTIELGGNSASAWTKSNTSPLVTAAPAFICRPDWRGARTVDRLATPDRAGVTTSPSTTINSWIGAVRTAASVAGSACAPTSAR
jgi:hypothetical protein